MAAGMDAKEEGGIASPSGATRTAGWAPALSTSLRHPVASLLWGEAAQPEGPTPSAMAILGLPMSPEEPQMGPRKVAHLESVPEHPTSVTPKREPRTLSHPLAQEPRAGNALPGSSHGAHHKASTRRSYPAANPVALQIVLQEFMVDAQGKAKSRLKYVGLRELYTYIDGLVSAEEEYEDEDTGDDSDSTDRPGSPISAAGTVDTTTNPLLGPPRASARRLTSSPALQRLSVSGAVRHTSSLVSPMRTRHSSMGGAHNPLSAFVWLHPRDLRKLSANYSLSNDSNFLVRKHVVLINFDPLRCIVLHDRLLLLVPDGADAMLLTLEHRLEEFCKPISDNVASVQDQDVSTPFELSAIEAVLSTVVSILNDEYAKLEPVVQETLRALHSNNLHYAQDRLKFVKNNIDAEATRVKNMRKAVSKVLDDDVDMAMMQLNKIRADPDSYSIPISPEVIEDHGNVEHLLETYLQSFSTIENQLSLLDQQIDNTEESVILKLDLARNRLLTVNTMIAIVGCGISFGSMVASIFGMNLRNGYEDSNAAFIGIILVIAVINVVFNAVLWAFLIHSGLLKT